MDLLSSRRKVIAAVFIIICGIFVLRLFYLQVLNKSYKQLANNNVLRPVTLYPARGLVYDRKGRLILYNQAEYDLLVTPGQVKQMDTAALCNTLGVDINIFKSEFDRLYKYSRYKPSVIVPHIQPDLYARLQEDLFMYPGFFTQVHTVRTYPYPAAAHVLGYISEVTPQQIKKGEGYYQKGDYIGTSGLELYYEKQLRGTKGKQLMLVDVHNRLQGSFNNGEFDTLAIPGKNMYTTLDIELQQYGEKLMAGKIGSVVAIEPATGEILAMISSPSYDPRLLTGRDRGKNFKALMTDTLKPLFIRPLKAAYPPGSTYKPLIGLIALEEGVVGPNESYNCPGAYYVGSLRVGCHHSGYVPDIKDAVQHSCNSYFCMSFRRVVDNSRYHSAAKGLDVWKDFLNQMGLGIKLDTDLPGVGYGFVPGSAYYDKIYGKDSWNSVTVISLGIGQGEIGETPLQMANSLAVICNRGYYYTPHLVKRIEGDSTNTLNKFKQKHEVKISKNWFELIVQGMYDVVTGGTGRVAQIPGVTVGGKTGTAQNPHGKDHSLFVAFAPVDSPKIAIAVIVENAGFGATYGAPIASLMMEKYLNDTIAKSRLPLQQRMFDADLINRQNVIYDGNRR